MSRAIGMVEYKTVSSGIMAADLMVKTAEIDIVEAQTVCPGKYIILITGDLSAVNASVEAARIQFETHLIDSFILGNPHDGILPAIYGATVVEDIEALGVLETYSAASIIVAADVAAKTAAVELVEVRVARGMCGKSYLMLTGEISSVTASIEAAKKAIEENGMYLDSSVLAHPDKKLRNKLM